MVFLSILIPIYNTKIEYLIDCIESIKYNNFFDIEIFLINDGSNEKITFFLNNYKLDNRFKIINNEKNIGVSKSFNKYIEKCKGDYFTYIDSDDYINKNTFEIFYKYAKNFNFPDMIKSIGRYNVFQNKIQLHLCDNKPICYKLLNKNNLNMFFNTYRVEVWGGIYKTEIAKKIKWNENIKGANCQDLGFIYKFVYLLNNFVYIEECNLYHRIYNESNGKKIQNSYDIISEMELMKKYKYYISNEIFALDFSYRLKEIIYQYNLSDKKTNNEIFKYFKNEIKETPIYVFQYLPKILLKYVYIISIIS